MVRVDKMKKDIELIAEIAQGYEGDEKLSELLVTGAIAANADAVKFQLVYADELATPDYQYYDLFKSLEMKQSVWKGLCSLIHENGKKVYFDIFGLTSLEMAKRVGADGVKLSTTEFYNNRLFNATISMFDTLYVSVGGISVEDIDNKVSNLGTTAAERICLMYGFQAEPTPLNQNNLIKLKLLKERYPSYKIGFMDHSDGGLDEAFYLPLISLGVGVDVIEKHITLDRELKLEDFVSGLTPSSFSSFVKLIRKYETVMGKESFELSSQEEEYRGKATKSVVTTRNIKVGEVIKEEDVALKRSSIPITSDSLLEIEMVLGKTSNIDLDIHTPILRGYV